GDAIRAVAEAARKRSLQIGLAGFERPITVRADRRMMRQILLNLLSNAVKFNRDGGRVTLSGNTTPSGEVVIAVEDTGIGVDPKAISELFEPFRQADSRVARTYGGPGLGLAIARQLVRLNGGDVAMESTPNVGTRISSTLPADRLVLDGAPAKAMSPTPR